MVTNPKVERLTHYFASLNFSGGIFTRDEIDNIIACLPRDLKIGKRDFQDRIEGKIRHVRFLAKFAINIKPPSQQLRNFRRLQNSLFEVVNQISRLNSHEKNTIEFVADDLEFRKTNSSKEFFSLDPKSENFDPENRARRRMWAFGDQIEWLIRVLDEVIKDCEMATAVAGGNRIDVAAHELMLQLHQLVIEACGTDEGLTAHTNRETDEVIGPLAEYLIACTSPLGVTHSSGALVKTYKRANRKASWDAFQKRTLPTLF